MAKLTVKQARELVWAGLRKVAVPDETYGWDFSEFIADYAGSDRCAALFAETELYQNARVLFITPDHNLCALRARALSDGKTVVMTNYGITRGFFLVPPGALPPEQTARAGHLEDVEPFWRHQTLAELRDSVGRIDVMITGASAITPSGLRYGKGHGYFDLEWAMTYTFGLVDSTTAVVAFGHDCQLVDADVSAQPYDTAIDYIVTNTRVLKTRGEFPKPSCGVLWDRLNPGMMEQIAPLAEVYAYTHPQGVV